jgi:hypothetical protein
MEKVLARFARNVYRHMFALGVSTLEFVTIVRVIGCDALSGLVGNPAHRIFLR